MELCNMDPFIIELLSCIFVTSHTSGANIACKRLPGYAAADRRLSAPAFLSVCLRRYLLVCHSVEIVSQPVLLQILFCQFQRSSVFIHTSFLQFPSVFISCINFEIWQLSSIFFNIVRVCSFRQFSSSLRAQVKSILVLGGFHSFSQAMGLCQFHQFFKFHQQHMHGCR